jgi:cation-transporting ATPase 13A3/4/5
MSPIPGDGGGDVGDLGDVGFCVEPEDDEDSADLEQLADADDYVMHRRSSTQSRGSVHSRLLRRSSGVSASSGFGLGRSSQKLYIASEDLTIVIAGFRTSVIGLSIYVFICVSTLGLGWLLFRWLPRWQVKVVGQPSPLRECQWVVIEVRNL